MANRNVFQCVFYCVLLFASCQDRSVKELTDKSPINTGMVIPSHDGVAVKTKYEKVVDVALHEVGEKEYETNWSPRIKQYLSICNINTPAYWCGAFTSFVQDSCRLPYPDGCAWTPNWFTPKRVYWHKGNDMSKARIGTNVGFYFNSKKRIAHIGILYKIDEDSGVYQTIEGNATANSASRNGDGVYVKIRQPWEIHQMSDWTK